MNRVLCIMMCLFFILPCIACSKKSDNRVVIDIDPVSASYTPNAEPTQEPSATLPVVTVEPTDTPEPVESIEPTESPEPTNEPTAVPSNEPVNTDCGLRFAESSSLPLPSADENIAYGRSFCFGGTITSGTPITEVTAILKTADSSPITYKVSYNESENLTSVELMDRTFSATGAFLAEKVKFENLLCGNYTFELYARNTLGQSKLAATSFRITKEDWNSLITNDLRNNYEYALKFFGSRDEFMFRYRWASGRDIVIEDSWAYSHMTYVTAPNGKKWTVHKKAVPYFQKAFKYLETTYIRVNGKYDSGIIKLNNLVREYGGTYVSRFVSDKTFISHHSFGTAIDINHIMPANTNKLVNRAVIRYDVLDHLTYNGIKEKNGIKYYEFTYNGSCTDTYGNVPTTIINYLLYELAFYRAGFGWGYYYAYGCDGMHFTLSEMDSSIHNTSWRSLRKVWTYCN